jgi:hypothetical protein
MRRQHPIQPIPGGVWRDHDLDGIVIQALARIELQ